MMQSMMWICSESRSGRISLHFGQACSGMFTSAPVRENVRGKQVVARKQQVLASHIDNINVCRAPKPFLKSHTSTAPLWCCSTRHMSPLHLPQRVSATSSTCSSSWVDRLPLLLLLPPYIISLTSQFKANHFNCKGANEWTWNPPFSSLWEIHIRYMHKTNTKYSINLLANRLHVKKIHT